MFQPFIRSSEGKQSGSVGGPSRLWLQGAAVFASTPTATRCIAYFATHAGQCPRTSGGKPKHWAGSHTNA